MEDQKGLVDISNVLSLCTCPKTGKVYRHPISLEDGHVYEQSFLNSWFQKRGFISPTTEKSVSSDFTVVIQLKSFLDDLFEAYPHLETLRYKSYEPKWKLPWTTVDAQRFIRNGEWKKLTKCEKIDFAGIGHEAIKSFGHYAPFAVFNHVVDHAIDLEVVVDNDRTLINYACKSWPNEKIKFLLSRSSRFDVNKASNNGNTPLHCYLRRWSSKKFDVIQVLLQAGADLHVENENGDTCLKLLLQKFSDFAIDILPYIDPTKITVKDLAPKIDGCGCGHCVPPKDGVVTPELKAAYEKRLAEWKAQHSLTD